MKTIVLNNLNTQQENISSSIAVKIEALINKNYIESNDGEYTVNEITALLSNKTASNIYHFMQKGLSVIISDEDSIIGFGMVVRKNNIYEAKYLNVDPAYKGKGIGNTICNIREKTLKEMGIRELYIESLRFDNTSRFHKNRGFYDVPDLRDLKFTKYMKKDL